MNVMADAIVRPAEDEGLFTDLGVDPRKERRHGDDKVMIIVSETTLVFRLQLNELT
jgi:hypothetical protein